MTQELDELALRLNHGYHDSFKGNLINLASTRCNLNIFGSLSSIYLENNNLCIRLEDNTILEIPLKQRANFTNSSIMNNGCKIKNLFFLIEYIYDFMDYKFSWEIVDEIDEVQKEVKSVTPMKKVASVIDTPEEIDYETLYTILDDYDMFDGTPINAQLLKNVTTLLDIESQGNLQAHDFNIILHMFYDGYYREIKKARFNIFIIMSSK